MKPNIELLNVDCMDYLKTVEDKAFDLAIVDPPYGLDGKLVEGGTWAEKWKGKGAEWDAAPKAEYWQELFRVTKNWIVFGGNYFMEYMPNCRHFIAWHKPYMDGMHTMSNVELAFTSFDSNAKKVSFNKDKGNEERIHVCQKPVALYKWALQHYAQPGQKILDTHGGSMSIAIACADMGFDLVCCEKDTDYYNDAVKRYNRHISQGKLFKPEELRA